MSWFKIIKKDNSSDYKIPDDVKSFISDLEDVYEESRELTDNLENAEYNLRHGSEDEDELEEVKQEIEDLSSKVYALRTPLISLIKKYKIEDMDWSPKEIEKSPIQMQDKDDVDYQRIIDALKENFYVDPHEDTTPKRGNENKKIVEELDAFQTQHYEQYGTPEQNQRLEAFTSVVSNGDVSNLRSRFPFAHLVFDEAGLLGDLE